MRNSDSLLINSFFNILYQLLNAAFPLITSAYVARILLPTGVGKVTVAQNFAQYFIVFAALGIPNYGIREISISRNSKTTSKVFSELWLINAISTLISLVLYIFLIFNIPEIKNSIPLYLIVGLGIVFNFLNIDWLYQGLEQYKYIAIRSFCIKFLLLILILAFVHTKEDVELFALFTVLGLGLNNIVNCFNLKKLQIRPSFKSVDIVKHIKPIVILFSTIVAIQVYTLLTTTLLGLFATDTQVAYYSNNLKIVRILITIITALSTTLLPRLSIYIKRGLFSRVEYLVNLTFEILLFILLPTCIGLLFLADKFVPLLFGESFAPSIQTMQILSLLMITLGFSNLFGTQILVTYGKEKQLMYSTLLGALVNVALCVVLIPRFMADGAAFATVLSELTVTLCCFCFARQCLTIHINRKILLKTVFSSLFMIPFLTITNLISNNRLITIFLSVVIGSISYFIFAIISKNQIFTFIMGKIIRR